MTDEYHPDQSECTPSDFLGRNRKDAEDRLYDTRNLQDQMILGSAMRKIILISVSSIIASFIFFLPVGETAFDLQGYYNEYKDYYGDVPLENVAKDAFLLLDMGKDVTYDNWRQQSGVAPVIEEDNRRRAAAVAGLNWGKITGKAIAHTIAVAIICGIIALVAALRKKKDKHLQQITETRTLSIGNPKGGIAMETVKKIIAVCYCCAIIFLIMIVPWKLDYHSETISRKIDKGYAFLFSPPIPAATIDFSMIFLEIIFITTVTAIIYVMRDKLFKNGDPNGRMNKTKIKKLVGVRGWLLLLVVGMMVLYPLGGVISIASEFLTAERQNPSLASSDVWRTFTTAIMWVFAGFSAISIYGGWGLTQGNSQSAVKRAKVILWITGPVSSLVLWVMVPFLVFDNYAVDAQFIRPFVSSLVSASIWTLYLSKSKRVHNTYGNNADSPKTVNTELPIAIQSHIAKVTPISSPDRDANNAPPVIRPEVSVDEERIYAAIATELETGAIDKGLWTRLFAECGGDEKQMKVNYIKQRAERLISAKCITAEKANAERIISAKRIAVEKAEAEKTEAKRIASEKAATDLQKKVYDEKTNAERIAVEKADAERYFSKKAAAEKAALEQFEVERVAAELRKKAFAERVEAQRIADEKVNAELRKKTDILIENQKRYLQKEAEHHKVDKTDADHIAAVKGEIATIKSRI